MSGPELDDGEEVPNGERHICLAERRTAVLCNDGLHSKHREEKQCGSSPSKRDLNVCTLQECRPAGRIVVVRHWSRDVSPKARI